MGWIRRTTLWTDDRGSVLQVASAVLDSDSWEALAEAVERVGPFDDADELGRQAAAVATALARRQYPGQQELLEEL